MSNDNCLNHFKELISIQANWKFLVEMGGLKSHFWKLTFIVVIYKMSNLILSWSCTFASHWKDGAFTTSGEMLARKRKIRCEGEDLIDLFLLPEFTYKEDADVQKGSLFTGSKKLWNIWCFVPILSKFIILTHQKTLMHFLNPDLQAVETTLIFPLCYPIVAVDSYCTSWRQRNDTKSWARIRVAL